MTIAVIGVTGRVESRTFFLLLAINPKRRRRRTISYTMPLLWGLIERSLLIAVWPVQLHHRDLTANSLV